MERWRGKRKRERRRKKGREKDERNHRRRRRRENKTSERDRRMIRPSRTKKRKKRSRNGRECQKKTTSRCGKRGDGKGEHERTRSRWKLSNKDVSYFYILGKGTEGCSERGLWCYYSVCYCGKCYYYGVYGAERESFPQKEHVCVKTPANIICHLLSTRGAVPLNGLKRRVFQTKRYFFNVVRA